MANILILGVKVPFTSGGQEVLVQSLARELKVRGHLVDLVELPFSPVPKEALLTQAAMWRSLELGEFGGKQVDLVIATKFPSYYARHPGKSLWLVHQHRAIYDLYGSRYSDFSDDPRDEALRRMLVEGDKKVLAECSFVSGISKNVSKRLKDFCGIEAKALYPPLPLGSRYRCAEAQNYVLCVGRICAIKRPDLMIKALPIVHNIIKLKIAGVPDEPGIMDYLNNEIAKHHLQDRVEFLGRVSDQELIELYAGALAVYYAPHNEDYCYVTLEAMASGKPIITAHDSGGVLEFVQDGVQGLVVEPNTDAIGHALNRLVDNRKLAEELGQNGRKFVKQSGLLDSGWDQVIDGLLSPIQQRRLSANA
ncbi:MAG: glycosyl transferase family 1 [Proteobacteria bacterium]|nr:MAG: glycosyl transferase family 1 [Pseudomonadota bacterium]